jgi:hypothetical protein
VVDYHVHLKGGWTLEQALQESRRTGIQYGIAVKCGVGFPITNDGGIKEFLQTMAGQPVYVAMQAEGREWVKMFSPEATALFDYVFTDAMTFTDDRGKRMRLWIKEEVGEITDRQRFMDVIVERIVGVLNVALDTLPAVYLCGSLYRTLKANGPFAAALSPHGHLFLLRLSITGLVLFSMRSRLVLQGFSNCIRSTFVPHIWRLSML